jgi:hypothetical protein
MNDEVIHGPDTDIVVPVEVPEIRPGGFMLRCSPLDEIVLERLAPTEGPSEQSVTARLVFTDHGFQRFVEALHAVQHHLSINYEDSRKP